MRLRGLIHWATTTHPIRVHLLCRGKEQNRDLSLAVGETLYSKVRKILSTPSQEKCRSLYNLSNAVIWLAVISRSEIGNLIPRRYTIKLDKDKLPYSDLLTKPKQFIFNLLELMTLVIMLSTWPGARNDIKVRIRANKRIKLECSRFVDGVVHKDENVSNATI